MLFNTFFYFQFNFDKVFKYRLFSLFYFSFLFLISFSNTVILDFLNFYKITKNTFILTVKKFTPIISIENF